MLEFFVQQTVEILVLQNLAVIEQYQQILSAELPFVRFVVQIFVFLVQKLVLVQLDCQHLNVPIDLQKSHVPDLNLPIDFDLNIFG
ncbi:hypothetical protein D3C75_1235590 [compost metagenome]